MILRILTLLLVAVISLSAVPANDITEYLTPSRPLQKLFDAGGFENAPFSLIAVPMNDGLVYTRKSPGGTCSYTIQQFKNGGMRQIVQKAGDEICEQKLDDILKNTKGWQINSPLNPLPGQDIGGTWLSGSGSSQQQHEIIGAEFTTVKAGQFVAMKVLTCNIDGGNESIEWYAKGLGLIKFKLLYFERSGEINDLYFFEDKDRGVMY